MLFLRRCSPWAPQRGRRAILLLLIAAVRLLGALPAAEAGAESPRQVGPKVLTDFEQIWRMPEAEAKQWHRLRIEFLVYYYDPIWQAMWGRCGAADSYLSLGSKVFPLKPGQRLLVEGYLRPAGGMIVEEPRVTVLAEGVPLDPVSTQGAIGSTELFNKRFVSVEGIVDRQSARDANHQELNLVVEGRQLLVTFLLRSGEKAPVLAGSVVRAEGVYFARSEANWTAPKLELWVAGPDSIVSLGPLDRDPRFDLPATPLSRVADAPPGELVRVIGTVEAQEPGQSLTLVDDDGRLTLRTGQTTPVAPGAKVEAFGLPEGLGRERTLVSAVYRRAVPVLANFEEVAAVPESERTELHRVRFEYHLHYFDPLWKVAWGRCDGRDNYLSLGEQPFPVRAGQRLRVDGFVVPANGMKVEDAKVTVLGEAPLPEPLPTRGQIGNTERFDKHRAIVEGYVDRQFQNDPRHLELNVVTEGRAVTVRLLLPEATPAPHLEGMLIEARGVYAATGDPATGVPKLELWVQGPPDLVAKEPLAQDGLFALPAIPVENLAAGQPGGAVRVVGTVRAQQPGKSLTIRDETGQLVVLTPQLRPVPLGAQVEAVGFPLLVGAEWRLRDGLYRPTAAGLVAAGAGPSTLRLAAELRELPPAEAARGAPVQLAGIVTWTSPAEEFFFIRDASGGVAVFPPPQANPALIVGSKVTVTGTSAAGRFTPVVMATAMRPEATIELPEAKQVTLAQAMTGIEEAQWVSMSGFVRGITRDGRWVRLEIATAAGEFSAQLPEGAQLQKVLNSVVRVRGVCCALTNAKRQLTGIMLRVPGEQFLEVEEAEPEDPFAVVAQSITSLRQFGSLQNTNRRVRVGGIVVHRAAGNRLHIQEGAEGLLVLGRGPAAFAPGDRIEAVGFPGQVHGRIVLREAVCRRVAAGEEPAPLAIARVDPVDVELDGRLVRLPALVLDPGGQGGDGRLILRAADALFEASLDSAGGGAWVEGSSVELTGVYKVEFDEYQRPHAVRLLLRSPRDVRIVRQPSWWTAGRALAVAGVLGIGIVLGIGWVVALRRRVRRQTGQIRAQVESERAARLEAALARASKLESLGVLAGGIAHDFNNLLTVMMGNLSLAKLDPRLEPETRVSLQESEHAALRARDLTQQLITFAKGGAPVRTVTALPEVVREATDFALHGSKVRCDYDLAAEAWPAEVDRGQIGQVVHNIVINAIHAMPGGGVLRVGLHNEEVAAGVRPALAAGRYLRLAIADSGGGIPPEHLPRIFDPYFTTKAKGHGLGLATVYSIVKKHDGHIEVASKPGDGTTFVIWLPATTARPVAEPPAAGTEPKPARPPGGRILLMDDEPAIRALGSAMFKRLGLECTATADGAAALRSYETERAEGRPFDLVVLDLTVPGGMGGAEAMERLRRIDPGVRAVVSSGYSNDPVMADYRAFGFRGVVAKPYELAELARVINPLLAERGARR